jgi:hypothetical protein
MILRPSLPSGPACPAAQLAQRHSWPSRPSLPEQLSAQLAWQLICTQAVRTPGTKIARAFQKKQVGAPTVPSELIYL